MQPNCWKYLSCGREPGGNKVDELGVCPAATDDEYAGVNGGVCGGRFCWAVAGTLCGGKVQGSFAQKALDCMHDCEFYAVVVRAEGSDVIVNPSELE